MAEIVINLSDSEEKIDLVLSALPDLEDLDVDVEIDATEEDTLVINADPGNHNSLILQGILSNDLPTKFRIGTLKLSGFECDELLAGASVFPAGQLQQIRIIIVADVANNPTNSHYNDFANAFRGNIDEICFEQPHDGLTNFINQLRTALQGSVIVKTSNPFEQSQAFSQSAAPQAAAIPQSESKQQADASDTHSSSGNNHSVSSADAKMDVDVDDDKNEDQDGYADKSRKRKRAVFEGETSGASADKDAGIASAEDEEETEEAAVTRIAEDSHAAKRPRTDTATSESKISSGSASASSTASSATTAQQQAGNPSFWEQPPLPPLSPSRQISAPTEGTQQHNARRNNSV